MFTHAPRIRPLRLALATALIAGTLSGSAMAATGDSAADLDCRKAGGTQDTFAAAAAPGGEQSIIAI